MGMDVAKESEKLMCHCVYIKSEKKKMNKYFLWMWFNVTYEFHFNALDKLKSLLIFISIFGNGWKWCEIWKIVMNEFLWFSTIFSIIEFFSPSDLFWLSRGSWVWKIFHFIEFILTAPECRQCRFQFLNALLNFSFSPTIHIFSKL
jgi:hypothetical protein